jgi:hypothetical protein
MLMNECVVGVLVGMVGESAVGGGTPEVDETAEAVQDPEDDVAMTETTDGTETTTEGLIEAAAGVETGEEAVIETGMQLIYICSV